MFVSLIPGLLLQHLENTLNYLTGPEAQKQTSKPGRRKYATRNGGKKRRISDPESGDTFVIDLDTNSEPGKRLYCTPSILTNKKLQFQDNSYIEDGSFLGVKSTDFTV